MDIKTLPKLQRNQPHLGRQCRVSVFRSNCVSQNRTATINM